MLSTLDFSYAAKQLYQFLMFDQYFIDEDITLKHIQSTIYSGEVPVLLGKKEEQEELEGYMRDLFPLFAPQKIPKEKIDDIFTLKEKHFPPGLLDGELDINNPLFFMFLLIYRQARDHQLSLLQPLMYDVFMSRKYASRTKNFRRFIRIREERFFKEITDIWFRDCFPELRKNWTTDEEVGYSDLLDFYINKKTEKPTLEERMRDSLSLSRFHVHCVASMVREGSEYRDLLMDFVYKVFTEEHVTPKESFHDEEFLFKNHKKEEKKDKLGFYSLNLSKEQQTKFNEFIHNMLADSLEILTKEQDIPATLLVLLVPFFIELRHSARLDKACIHSVNEYMIRQIKHKDAKQDFLKNSPN